MQPIGKHAGRHQESPDAQGRHDSENRTRGPSWNHGDQKHFYGREKKGPLDTVNGQQGSWFRSYDKATGEIVSETLLPANTTGVPMTYMANNKQYIVVAVAAPGRPAELVALALP